MKTLEELGEQLIVHKEVGGILRMVKCPCGLSHMLYEKETTRFVDCKCGKRVELCRC